MTTQCVGVVGRLEIRKYLQGSKTFLFFLERWPGVLASFKSKGVVDSLTTVDE